ncbi:PREDICTED: ribonuclease P protein subunit p30 [Vollenhovia emeryi]|uniref:ribonuclease P protein subunit p30 n=1 Tax=Vollenhovia emeryi TaxID=411798 RepID=UPI0005F39E8B|nr:PREDICTED: ribonuclease P protein subunit p30 [Vollenhovia emeryi]
MESMNSCEGFFDLCVNVPDGGTDSLNDILLKLYEMGYRTVALNQTVNGGDEGNSEKTKQKKQKAGAVPEPIDVSKLNEKWRGKLRLLNRITLICSNVDKAHALAHCATLKKYDIYALVPTKQSVLESICSQIRADLVTIKPDISGIKINQKVYRQAMARDLYFEIQYADLLRRETRVATLHNSYRLQTCRISMNVIISSGANSKNLIRNPYDIINLGSVLGLRPDTAKAVISNECHILLLKAKRRMSGKAVFTVEFATESERKKARKDESLN